jgi:Cu/Ag efflux protein CusF
MKRVVIPLVAGLSLGLPAWADSGHAEHVKASTHAAALSEGVVKKVDKAQGKLTLRHGPLENLDMPSMTMVFRVREASWLDQLKPGDAVRFLAEQVAGVITVTQLEIVR